MKKCVFIDIDNTLLDFWKCSENSIKKACEKTGVEYSDRLLKTFLPVNESLWKKVEMQEIRRNDVRAVRWGIVFEKLNINYDGKEFEEHFFSSLTVSHEKTDEAEDLLKYLKEKYIVCCASNSAYEQQMRRMTSAGLINYIDKMFVSDKIGFPKPSKEFFIECFKHLPGILPDDCVMIGDSLSSDIKGGNNMGMETILFNRENLTPKDDNMPTHIVYSLTEIMKII